jgi:hypothetical protein
MTLRAEGEAGVLLLCHAGAARAGPHSLRGAESSVQDRQLESLPSDSRVTTSLFQQPDECSTRPQRHPCIRQPDLGVVVGSGGQTACSNADSGSPPLNAGDGRVGLDRLSPSKSTFQYVFGCFSFSFFHTFSMQRKGLGFFDAERPLSL